MHESQLSPPTAEKQPDVDDPPLRGLQTTCHNGRKWAERRSQPSKDLSLKTLSPLPAGTRAWAQMVGSHRFRRAIFHFPVVFLKLTCYDFTRAPISLYCA